MSSTCRAAGVPALGVATNKHGQIRKMGEQNIIDYDRSLSGGMQNHFREVNKMLQGKRPHTAPEDSMRPSNGLGSLGEGFRPGSAANSRPDKGDFVQSSNSLRNLYDGLRPGSATQTTMSTGTPFATLNSVDPASSLNNLGEGLRPASAVNARQNKANPVQSVNNVAQAFSSVGSPGNGLRPGSAANGLRPRSAAGTLPNKANQMPNSSSLGSLTDAMRPGSAANSRANKGNSLQPLSSFGSAGEGLRPRSAAKGQPNGANPIQPSSGFAESLQAGNSAALPPDKGSPLQPSNNMGSFGDGVQPGGRIGDLLTNHHDEPLKSSKASKASKSTHWLEPSKLLGDLMKKQSQSRASTATPSTSKTYGLLSDDEQDQGFAMKGNSLGKSRRPNSSQRRTARLQKKKPGAKVGSGGMFSPAGQCFHFQIGETPSCSAFGNMVSKEPPAAGFKYWRDFKGSGGHFLGM